MAFHMDVELFNSSDEEEILIAIPPINMDPILDEEDDDKDDILRMLHPIFGIIQRIDHVKIYNYVENVVNAYNDVDFIMHFRLSRDKVYQLIDQFGVSQIYTFLQSDGGRPKVTAEKHILIYLWFVGHQSSSYRDVGDRFGITISALHNIITRVTDFLLFLAPNIIKYPTLEEKEETANFFHEKKGFPHIIGSIDGSHVRIDRPIADPDSYINRKQYFSLHLQGTVNHQMKFIDVFVGYPGSVHDARVFRNSPLRNDLRELCTGDYFLLGDSAYPCLKELIVPYRDNGHLTRAQRNFNTRLSSCRVIVENAFGCLKQRFRQLYHFKLRNIPRMVRIIYACCVLHNIANVQDIQYSEEPMDEEYPDIEARNVHINMDDVPRDEENGVHLRNQICQQLFTH